MGQFWNREDEIDPDVVKMLESVPPEWRSLSENTRIQLPDLKQAIRQTKTTTAPGCCGWTQPDLMCVPDGLLEQLITLWNSFLDGHIVRGQQTSILPKLLPPKKEDYFEHDGCPTDHDSFTPVSSPFENVDF